MLFNYFFEGHLSKAASMFSKAGENIRETSRIIKQIPSSRLLEISTGRLIF